MKLTYEEKLYLTFLIGVPTVMGIVAALFYGSYYGWFD